MNLSRKGLLLRGLVVTIALALFLGSSIGFWLRSQLRASLPQLDGSLTLAGLTAPVMVTRDGQGIPTIVGRSREDVARTTGFLHAQDRFFQMDLARRRAAGELAELVGERALAADRAIRIHRFRAEARQAVSLLTTRDRTLLDAYTSGVNAGLHALGASPFEYFALRQTPAPWLPEDTFLVVLSMFVALQEPDGAYEATLSTMHDVLPPQMFDFLAPRATEWDAPIDGSTLARPAVPDAHSYDLRSRRRGRPAFELPERGRETVRSGAAQPTRLALSGFRQSAPTSSDTFDSGGAEGLGSNNWVVSGAHTADGLPLLANDMHLTVRVPNTWYRAVLEWPGATGTTRRLVGVTLPGVPALVSGSNSSIAWGFTNTYADWSDIVLLDVDPGDANRYRTPDGWREFERHDETIRVAGQADQPTVVSWTIWGPVIGPDYRGRARAYRWVAHSAERLANTLTPLEDATSVLDAFDAANGLGTPGQNLVVADRDGRIGWSVYGAIPRRVGTDGRLPASWSDGTRGWHGWLAPAEYPRVVDPPSGRIWTANARVVGGDMLAKLGDGSYEVGSRATIIRRRLDAQERFTKQDLLRIQMDVSADFLARWRELILQTLTPATLNGHQAREQFRQIVETQWSGRVTPDSVAYRLTRSFREAVVERIVRFVLVECYEADPSFDYFTVRRRESPIWALVTERPQHLLDPRYSTWPDLLVSAVDAVIDEAGTADLRTLVWSDYNVTAYRHPLSAAIPFSSRWLDMPLRPLPGDLFTPQMHWGSAAASERLIVSPGHESEGIMHMPTGQSGHPLSPFYAASHQAWIDGDPTPLMPGPTRHTLMLEP
ncbi:MAG TPA: penicillin acylase family protein [Vicinamibacterales bacterium]|nr:penicillin acylase family protein [Vicinamibacterales bacterium]